MGGGKTEFAAALIILRRIQQLLTIMQIFPTTA